MLQSALLTSVARIAACRLKWWKIGYPIPLQMRCEIVQQSNIGDMGYHSQQNGRQSKESLSDRVRTGNKLVLMWMVIGLMIVAVPRVDVCVAMTHTCFLSGINACCSACDAWRWPCSVPSLLRAVEANSCMRAVRQQSSMRYRQPR